MRWWDAIKTRLGAKSKEVAPVTEVHRLVHLAYGHLLMEEYEQARSVLLQAIPFRSAIEKPETVTFLLTSLESTWIFTEQFEDGMVFFSDYVCRFSRDFAAYRGRAAILWYSGRLQEAIEDYSRSLELKPMDIIALSGRGQVFAELGNHEKAMEDLDGALEGLSLLQWEILVGLGGTNKLKRLCTMDAVLLSVALVNSSAPWMNLTYP